MDAVVEGKPRVLYVDDEEPNLIVFEARLRNHADVRVAKSAKEGLRILAQEEIPVVISDQVMPEMTGNEFLAEVRRKYPDTVRMLMTAYTNFDDVVSAINGGQISRFIKKPWEPHDLLTSIVNGQKYYATMQENRALTQKLLQRERLSAVGQVASGLVNELDGIAYALDVANHIRLHLKGDVSKEFDVMMRGVERLKLLVDTVRTYAAGGDDIQLHTERVDLNELIPAMFSKFRLLPSVGQLAKLDFVSPGTRVQALVDVKKFEQVLLNLVKNAAEASPESKGAVELTLTTTAGRAHIAVRDNGPGVPDEILERVWNGFYTTKGESGTGLGLLISRKIIKAHAGDISFSYRPDKGGAVVVVDLPIFGS